MIGRLPRSRSPPHPKTQMTLPRAQTPERRQHRLERVGLVRVIDQHRHPRFARHRLQSAGGPWASPHTLRHRIRFDAQGHRHSRGAQDIEQVDFAEQRRIDFDFLCRAPTSSRECRSGPRRMFSGCTSSERSRPKLIFESCHRVEHAPAEGIVAAHDRDRIRALAARQNLGEQPQLGGEVIFDRRRDSPDGRGRGW